MCMWPTHSIKQSVGKTVGTWYDEVCGRMQAAQHCVSEAL